MVVTRCYTKQSGLRLLTDQPVSRWRSAVQVSVKTCLLQRGMSKCEASGLQSVFTSWRSIREQWGRGGMSKGENGSWWSRRCYRYLGPDVDLVEGLYDAFYSEWEGSNRWVLSRGGPRCHFVLSVWLWPFVLKAVCSEAREESAGRLFGNPDGDGGGSRGSSGGVGRS